MFREKDLEKIEADEKQPEEIRVFASAFLGLLGTVSALRKQLNTLLIEQEKKEVTR